MKSSFNFFISFLVAVITGGIFTLIITFSSMRIFLILSILFLVTLLLLFLLLNTEKRKEHTWSLTLITGISMLFMLSIIEDSIIRWIFVIMSSLLLAILFSSKENEEIKLEYARKPFRRFVMMVWVFDIYALFSFLFAIGVLFQSESPIWLEIFLIPVAGIIAGFIAGEIWKMYIVAESKAFLFFRILVALFMSEFFWSLRLLPFGYMISALPITWMWYILQILIRFHLQEQGIVWKKQIPFLVMSCIIFLILGIFFVRWI